ncbi:hypothetical protein HOY82DRAFT_634131 [Tuber indicum]|nr:hypothetical protein HOY82DRAFT_634131 [Tuber indicum]
MTVQPLYFWMAATMINDYTVKIAISIHVGVYSTDNCTSALTLLDGENMQDVIAEYTSNTLATYSTSNMAIFMQTAELDDHGDTSIDVAEQADSSARECVRHFDADHNPALAIDGRNRLMRDVEGAIRAVEGLGEYQSTVHKPTWNTLLKYSSALRGYNDGQTESDPERPPTKTSFFSATQHGGDAALIRHALFSLCSKLGADMSWFDAISSMVHTGADVVVIDDPSMPAPIPLIKHARPAVKIIYRPHFEVRKDLVERVGSPPEQVWQWIWDSVKEADVFISHPVDKYVLHNFPFNIFELMPACTNWFDGLNTPFGECDLKFYHGNLHTLCNAQKTNHVLYPAREDIPQIARFDLSKGIAHVVESHPKFCHRMQTLYAAIAKDVVVARIWCSYRMLNAIITTEKIVLQLSLREGFEVVVSEALYHGKPVVTTAVGGIPLQIEHRTSGFLVEVGHTDSVANTLFDYTPAMIFTP